MAQQAHSWILSRLAHPFYGDAGVAGIEAIVTFSSPNPALVANAQRGPRRARQEHKVQGPPSLRAAGLGAYHHPMPII